MQEMKDQCPHCLCAPCQCCGWKGNKANYRSKHARITRRFGQPQFCEKCRTKKAKRYEWANISGKYKIERSDWKRLCTKCHQKMDGHGVILFKKIKTTKWRRYIFNLYNKGQYIGFVATHVYKKEFSEQLNAINHGWSDEVTPFKKKLEGMK